MAYAAAESGVNYYKFKLDADPDYWSRCARQDATAPTPVNQPGTVPARWRTIPGATAQYTIELIPAPGFAQCVENNAASVIDPQTGALRIRVTGRPSATSSVRRTIVAGFRRDSFLDYLYFTDFETLDPDAYSTTGTPNSTWAGLNCKVPRESRPNGCEEITFWGFDKINGPFHTNDDIQTCGAPVFGRSAADVIEVSGPSPGWGSLGGSSCAGSPTFSTPLVSGAYPQPIPAGLVGDPDRCPALGTGTNTAPEPVRTSPRQMAPSAIEPTKTDVPRPFSMPSGKNPFGKLMRSGKLLVGAAVAGHGTRTKARATTNRTILRTINPHLAQAGPIRQHKALATRLQAQAGNCPTQPGRRRSRTREDGHSLGGGLRLAGRAAVTVSQWTFWYVCSRLIRPGLDATPGRC